ncbi:MAG: hypothetical protein ACK5H2_11045 [Beutenbergiaceae bacterium]
MSIKYAEAVWDENEQSWIFEAQVAQIGYTSFTSRRRADHINAR